MKERPDTAYRQLEEASALLTMASLCFERALQKLGKLREVDKARRHAVKEMHQELNITVDILNALIRRMHSDTSSDVGASS